MARLKERYIKEVIPALMKEFGYKNVMQVPRVEKAVINIGVGAAVQDPKQLDNAVRDLSLISGQRPVITRAKKSIANFKIRAGMRIGTKVTLRGDRMYEFLDKLFNIALPRVRDFGGVSPSSFDGRGNLAMGLREQLVFPEIDYDSIDKVRGMDVVIATNAKTDEEARALLTLMGMPFRER
ncbi:MAG: 50S ribosomal protein L5 [Armatimonadetes bacterium]|nr:50S ribosomal protein L5 [Armatimonadota bacterium]NIM23752.1 50S ribosomal protein L5 [Armatimonadota bacterium]NIM67629.1 50S ribosomal protein L5 [Armatimonadota bacterium]NIN06850.1 50S ribosomal protein L5 [Armatimonadota bacterium]NIO97178.1 50S ribosomal protein L5 [Armatimonadota bacterium]